MSVEQRNSSGHQVSIPEAESKGTGIAGEGLSLGSIVYVKASDGNLYKHDGDEFAAAAIVGVCDGSYSTGNPAAYFQNGDLASGFGGLTTGTEYWAKEDGTLVPYPGVGAGMFTRLMGIAISANALQLQIGEVVQKP